MSAADWHSVTVDVCIEPGATYRFSCGDDTFEATGRELFEVAKHYVADLKIGVIWRQDRKLARPRRTQ